VLGIGAHQPVATDLGEDAGGGDNEAPGVGFDHPLDVWDVRRHEVPAAVDDGGVGQQRQLADRPTGGEALRRRHPEIVALGLAGVPDTPRLTPRRDTIEKSFPVALGEHLRVAYAVEAAIAGQHCRTDGKWTCPRPAADLVDADHDRMA
jgi:hypothetical protein